MSRKHLSEGFLSVIGTCARNGKAFHIPSGVVDYNEQILVTRFVTGKGITKSAEIS